MKKTYLTDSAGQTRKLGKKLAKEIIKGKKISQKSAIFGLRGDLGGGKTTFLQGFAKGLGITKKILSPTFVIMKRFPLKKNKAGFKSFYHFDCYRLHGLKDVMFLGFKKIIKNPKNIVAIEWPEKIKGLPKRHVRLEFQLINDKKRKITITK